VVGDIRAAPAVADVGADVDAAPVEHFDGRRCLVDRPCEVCRGSRAADKCAQDESCKRISSSDWNSC
jgi:hypothetical protein